MPVLILQGVKSFRLGYIKRCVTLNLTSRILIRFKDGAELPQTSSHLTTTTTFDASQYRVTSELAISSMELGDAGNYKCAYVSSLDSLLKKSDNITLTLFGMLVLYLGSLHINEVDLFLKSME